MTSNAVLTRSAWPIAKTAEETLEQDVARAGMFVSRIFSTVGRPSRLDLPVLRERERERERGRERKNEGGKRAGWGD